MPAHRIPSAKERFDRLFDRFIREKDPVRKARLDHALDILANWPLLFPSS